MDEVVKREGNRLMLILFILHPSSLVLKKLCHVH